LWKEAVLALSLSTTPTFDNQQRKARHISVRTAKLPEKKLNWCPQYKASERTTQALHCTVPL